MQEFARLGLAPAVAAQLLSQLPEKEGGGGGELTFTAKQVANALRSNPIGVSKTVPDLILEYCSSEQMIVCVRFLLLNDLDEQVGWVEAARCPGFDKFRPYNWSCQESQLREWEFGSPIKLECPLQCLENKVTTKTPSLPTRTESVFFVSVAWREMAMRFPEVLQMDAVSKVTGLGLPWYNCVGVLGCGKTSKVGSAILQAEDKTSFRFFLGALEATYGHSTMMAVRTTVTDGYKDVCAVVDEFVSKKRLGGSRARCYYHLWSQVWFKHLAHLKADDQHDPFNVDLFHQTSRAMCVPVFMIFSQTQKKPRLPRFLFSKIILFF